MTFTLVTAPAGTSLQSVSNSSTINLASLPTRSLSINIVPSTSVGSVRIQHNGDDRTENFAPYSLAGDTDGSFNPADMSLGTHTVTVTPYPRPNQNGTPGASTTISFTVVDRALNTPPVLLTEQNSDVAIAFNAVTFVRGPFQLQTQQNFSSDKRTRVLLFVDNFDANLSPLVQGDSAFGSFNLPVEHIGPVPGFDAISQITIILPDGLEDAGDVWVRVMVNGMSSNSGRINLQQSSVATMWSEPLLNLFWKFIA